MNNAVNFTAVWMRLAKLYPNFIQTASLQFNLVAADLNRKLVVVCYWCK